MNYEELEKLNELKEKGVLTEDEFTKQKEKLLNVNSAEETKTETTNTTSSEQKSKIAAGLFGIFLGSLGIHNFYLGYIGKGLAQLLLTLPGSFITFGLGAIASGIWALIEAILIFTGTIDKDAKGNPLKD